MTIEYDTPIEVSAEQYPKIMKIFAGMVAGRQAEDGKYYIKLWNMKFKDELEKILKK